MQDFRTEIAKAKGMGSTKSGMHFWLMQRLTAVVIALCVIWICIFVQSISSKSQADIVLTLQKPHNSIILIILIITGLYHAALGMQVVIEDYISNLFLRHAIILGVKLFSYVTIISSIAAVIYLMVL